MARDDDNVLFQGVRVVKHKCNTLESVILELQNSIMQLYISVTLNEKVT
jgi:hypothetical protein